MNGNLRKLLDISSGALGPSSEFRGKTGLMRGLLELLSERNGFFTFESALLVRPGCIAGGAIIDARSWNEPGLWKSSYGELEPDAFCFAEDAFGNQFAVQSEGVIRFDSETAECQAFAGSLDEWATKILEDYELHTGYVLARDWQVLHGPMPAGSRLLARRPFVLGGEYAVGNLICWNDVKGMRARGALARQLKHVPEGGRVEFEYVD
jgi:hypothetical protein